MSEEETIYSCYEGNNSPVFARILRLYVPEGSTVADVTYGGGAFWRTVDASKYKLLATDLLTGVDFRDLPYGNEEINALVLDPPYMHVGGGNAWQTAGLTDRYKNNRSEHISATGKKFHERVVELYEQGITEARRVLRPNGILIVKCQDEVCQSRQRLTHVEIVNFCLSSGFAAEDLFVVRRTSKTHISSTVKRQQHARKNHSYFLVFRKNRK